MRKLIVLAVCLFFIVTHARMAPAIVIATSEHYQVTAEDIHPVGAGAAAEDLMAFTLTVTNNSGNPDWNPNAFDSIAVDGGIMGNLHHEWYNGAAVQTPVANATWISGFPPFDYRDEPTSAIDTHFLVREDGFISPAGGAPAEDFAALSNEPPSRTDIGGVTLFGAGLFGFFSDINTMAPVWELTHIAMPSGVLEFDALIGATDVPDGWERLTGSAMLTQPNLLPIVDAGGPYTMIGSGGQSLPDGGSVQFTGSAIDLDGTIEFVLWELSQDGTDWLTLPNGADTLNPVLTEYELRGMFGPDLSMNDTFDLRLTATDNMGATARSTATLTYVPEPSTWLLLVFGFGSLWFWRRR